MAFSDLTGQKNIKSRLASAVSERQSGTFMFTGPIGSGRHAFAEEFAKALMCSDPGADGACGKCDCCKYFGAGTTPDIMRVYKPTETKNVKVSFIKESVVPEAVLRPQFSKTKVFILDLDYLGVESQNALLKSLEEPPAHVVFILLSSNRDMVLDTVISRATEIKLDPYTNDEIIEIVKKNVPDCPAQTLTIAAANSGGVPGKAIEIAKQGEDTDLKREVAEMFLELPDATYFKILNDDAAFMADHKADAVSVACNILLLIDDLMRLKGVPGYKNISFADQRTRLEKLAGSSKIDNVKLGKCAGAVKDFLKALDVNANFDAASCAMLLKIHEELNK
jgi:DNA polymerase-3 subunit delta'